MKTVLISLAAAVAAATAFFYFRNQEDDGCPACLAVNAAIAAALLAIYLLNRFF